jgi:hypothetical protein
MDPSVFMGAFRFKTDMESKAMRAVEWLANLRSTYLKLPYGDQAFFLRKRVFESLGGFPPVAIAEDLFLVRKALRKGQVITLPVPVITSGRRWKRRGVVRVSLINLIIAAGCMLGVSPERLLPLYGCEAKTERTAN